MARIHPRDYAAGTTVEPLEIAGVECAWVSTPASDPSRIVFFVHGGAFVSTGLTEYMTYAQTVANFCAARVLVPAYSLAPEVQFPRQLDELTAPPDEGGWGFAYPSSKAAIARLVASLRVEYPDSGVRAFNLEPGMVVTETMRAAGIDELFLERFKPCSPAAIGAVVAWLAENEPAAEWSSNGTLRGPAIAKQLGELGADSLLDDAA